MTKIVITVLAAGLTLGGLSAEKSEKEKCLRSIIPMERQQGAECAKKLTDAEKKSCKAEVKQKISDAKAACG